MSADEKFKAGMWMIKTVHDEDMTHREKTAILRIAYRLLRESMLAINPHVVLGEDEVPF